MERLPHRLKMSMSSEIHKDLESSFTFFKRQPEKNFLPWVGHRLTPRMFQEEQYIYQETESISEVFFCCQGKIAYVLPRYDNACYYVAVKGDIFGLEDVIYNAHQLHGGVSDLKVMQKRKFYGDRRFSTMSLNISEALALSVPDLMKITSEFPKTIEVLYEDQSSLLEKLVVARVRQMDRCKQAQFTASGQMIQSVHLPQFTGLQVETPAF